MAVTSEIAGVTSTWQYPEVAPSFSAFSSEEPGLSSPDQLQSLTDLIDEHLYGPAKALALSNLRTAIDEYFALSVPEPSSLLLAASLLPLLSRRKASRSQAAWHDNPYS